jgi:hypothetical protein
VLVEALALTWVVRVALWTLPYAVARRTIGRAARALPMRSRAPARVAWAVAVAGDRVPGSTCLVRALVGEGLLSRSFRDATVLFGVRRGATGVEAHAWLEVDGEALIGRDERFVPLEEVSS